VGPQAPAEGAVAMTQTRTGDAWMHAGDYGRALPKFSVNLLVRDVQKSIPFYRDVLTATVRYADDDFAALNLKAWILCCTPTTPMTIIRHSNG
jgi:hypothetical protein